MVVADASGGTIPLTQRFPATRLLGAIGLAFDIRKLGIAALGLIVLQTGWSGLDRLFPTSASVTPNTFDSGGPAGLLALPNTRNEFWDQLAILHAWISEPIRLFTGPMFAMVSPGSGWITMLHALLSLLWVIVIWGICGGAIARIAVVQVTKARQTGIREALRFALRSTQSLIVAPLCPIVALAFCGTLCAAFGLLYRLPVIGSAVAGTGLFIPLAVGLLMTLLVIGLVAGWPLMVAAVASGAQDWLDAWSRSFNYLNQRIGPFVALLALLWLEGLISLVLVDLFAGEVIRLTQWGIGLTAGTSQVTAFVTAAPDKSWGVVASRSHIFWLGVVGILSKSTIYSFFWSAAVLVYLWLRHDVDNTPWTECDRPAASTAASR